MTLFAVPATLDLIMAIKPQPMQAHDILDPDVIAYVLPHADAEVVMVGQQPIACRLGVTPWSGRQQLNMLLSKEAGPHLLWIVRRFRQWLDQHGARRVEATTRSGWDQGARFLRMLGFEYACTMPFYAPDGSDHDLYERIR